MMLATKAYVLFAQSLTVCKPYIAGRGMQNCFSPDLQPLRTKA